jgi:hypothetical protein
MARLERRLVESPVSSKDRRLLRRTVTAALYQPSLHPKQQALWPMSYAQSISSLCAQFLRTY